FRWRNSFSRWWARKSFHKKGRPESSSSQNRSRLGAECRLGVHVISVKVGERETKTQLEFFVTSLLCSVRAATKVPHGSIRVQSAGLQFRSDCISCSIVSADRSLRYVTLRNPLISRHGRTRRRWI